VASILTSQSVTADDVRTEAAIVLRTVEHIAFDLDHFSKTVRHGTRPATVISDIERHLAQARRNCADATAIAEEILQFHADSGETTPARLQLQADQIRDAFALLTLADAAYLRAFEVAGRR
jgi:hypothetical protein